jgi:hypothetical protein
MGTAFRQIISLIEFGFNPIWNPCDRLGIMKITPRVALADIRKFKVYIKTRIVATLCKNAGVYCWIYELPLLDSKGIGYTDGMGCARDAQAVP